MPSDKKDEGRNYLWWFFGSVVFVVAVLVSVWLFVPGLLGPGRRDLGPGTFGDMFGVANALFSGLALAAVVIAIFMQRDQIRLQRQDLEHQREDLRLQREELALTRQELAREADASEEIKRITELQLAASTLPILGVQLDRERHVEGVRFWLTLNNLGATVFEAELATYFSGERIEVHRYPELPANDAVQSRLDDFNIDAVSVSFRDKTHRNFVQNFDRTVVGWRTSHPRLVPRPPFPSS